MFSMRSFSGFHSWLLWVLCLFFAAPFFAFSASSPPDSSYHEYLHELTVEVPLKGKGNCLIQFFNTETKKLIRTLEYRKDKFFRITHNVKGIKPQSLNKNGDSILYFFNEEREMKYYVEIKNGVRHGIEHYRLLHISPKAYVSYTFRDGVLNGDYSSFELEKEDLGEFGFYKDGLMDSTWALLLYDSIPISTVNFKNDVPFGPAFKYYEDGKIKSIVNYDDKGFLDGSYVEYYPDSSLKTLGKYVQNLKVGSWLYFDKNSNNLRDSVVYGDGFLTDNLVKGFSFYDDAFHQIDEVYYKNDSSGLKEGAFDRLFPESKTPFMSGFYKEGCYNGNFTFYWPDGKIRQTAVFNMDTLIYLSDFYLPQKGKTIPQTTFNNKTRSGIRVYYYENGRVASEQSYKNGILNGSYTSYFDAKKRIIESQGKYLDGVRQGNWRFFNPKGVLVAEGNYQEGEERGLWRYYNKKGALLREFVFE